MEFPIRREIWNHRKIHKRSTNLLGLNLVHNININLMRIIALVLVQIMFTQIHNHKKIGNRKQ